jgi:hypothetical protein
MIAGSVLFFTMAEYEATSLLVVSVSEGFDNGVFHGNRNRAA